MNKSFNIHERPTSEEDKKTLIKIIQKQNRTVIRNTFKISCAYCQKETSIEWLHKCFYCGLWFCTKCAREHFDKQEHSDE